MGLKKEDQKYKYLLRASIAASWLVALFAIGIYIFGQFVDRHDVLRVGSAKTLSIEWEYETSTGETGVCTLPHRFNIPVGETVSLTSVLPDDIYEGEYMVLSAGHDIKIYIDGQLRFFQSRESSRIPGRITKSGFFPLALSAADAGKVIKIVKDEEGAFNGSVKEMYYGEMYAITRELMSQYAFRFFASMLLLVFAVTVSVGSAVIRIVYKVYDKALRMLAYGMLSIALWAITDSYMYQFVFGNIFVEGIMGYILTPLMPISFIRYFNELQNKRYEKIYSYAIALLMLDEIIVCILHFTDIMAFERTLIYNDIVVAIAGLTVIGLLFKEYRDGYIEEYKWVAIGAGGLCLGAILEIVFINLHLTAFGDVWLILGIYFMLAMALVHTIGDILSREKERRKAIEASMIKSNFLANMSHEIRTPINAIMGMNEMILRESEDPDVLGYAEHIGRSGKLLLSIIGDVLDFSKIESGKLNIVSDPYKLSSLISDSYNLMNQLAAEKSLEVRFEADENMPSVLDGDENHIKQIVINLITNAAKYTKRGYIGLKAYATDIDKADDTVVTYERTMINVEISDSGIGIKQEDLPRLFDSFERVDERVNRNIQGTGLGLSIVKSLTEAMNGSVEVTSEYGVGSTFIVRIPQRVLSKAPVGDSWRAVAEYNKMDSDRARYKVSFKAPTAKIMAVDDNSSNLLIIKQFLKATELKVELVNNGEEAIDLAEESKYDVILLDHMMPDPDGIAVLKAIRKKENGLNYDTPVIVLTANATQDSRDEYLRQGFNDYIAKPVDGATLETTLMKYLPEDKLIMEDDTKENEDKNSKAEDSRDQAAEADDARKDAENMDKIIPSKENDYGGLFEREGFAQVLKVFGNKDFAFEIIHKVAEDSLKALDSLKDDLDKEDYADYAIKAHGIKGMMASVYYEPLRVRSLNHEMAAKEGRYDFIREDYEDYSRECREFCNSVLG